MAKKITLVAALALTATAASAASAPRYIVKLKSGASLQSFKSEAESLVASFNANFHADGTPEAKLTSEYDISDEFRAVQVQASPELLAELNAREDVEYVEEYKERRIMGTQANPPSWGLSRISQRDLSLPAPYTFPDSSGQGVNVYVIDTGILTSHPDFNGRATWGATLCPGCPNKDDNGHGTHCAGTIGGTAHGVAKNANLIAVKVCNAQGSCPSVMEGIDWVSKNGKPGSVVSMSLGGGYSKAENDAVTAVINKGFTFAIAAGNESKDACNTSPCTASGSICVGSTDKADRLSSFSNFGTCVSILAPGSAITSAWMDGKTNTISGTSMATPHVAGAAALLLAQSPSLTPAQVKAKLLEIATPNKITGAKGSPNLLLFNGASSVEPPASTTTATPRPTSTTVAPSPTTTTAAPSPTTTSTPRPTATSTPIPDDPSCPWWARYLGWC